MRTSITRLLALLLLVVLASTGSAAAQATTGSIEGIVTDNQGLVVPGASVTVRNIDTNVSRSVVTGADGGYRFLNMSVGNYELTVELTGFARYVRAGITLAVNQVAVVEVQVRPAALTEVVEVTADAPLLNTTNAEVGVRFDTQRVAELPVMGSRNIFTLARSAPGVSELASGQTSFASGTSEANFSSNGARLRSNNIMIDGQDSNDPSVTGRQQPINNTDIVQEIRLITNQFAAEFGRAAGSVMNVVTKSGTNDFSGSAFWFHNDNDLNSRSNLDKGAGRTEAPYRVENQVGGTRRRSSVPWTDVLLRLVPAVDRPPARFRVHAGRRAERCRSRGAAVGCGWASPRRSTVEAPAGWSTKRPVGHLHARWPDVHGASRFVDRIGVAVPQQQSGNGANRPPADAQPHADRPVPGQRYVNGQHRRRADHPVGPHRQQSREQPFVERMDQQRLRRQHVQRVQGGMVAPWHGRRA